MKTIEPFKIRFERELFDDLYRRIDETRIVDLPMGENWQFGAPASFLKDVLQHWKSDYDWFTTEDVLNSYPQYLWKVNGMKVHFFHIPSSKPYARTILMAHGWPDSFLRYHKTFDLLKDFNLVVPTMPGFGFSTLPEKGFINNSDVADLWHTLMTDVLGYQEYFATGGDMGRGVVCYLASRYPEEVKGLHLTDVGMAKDILTAPDNTLSAEELDYKHRAQQWLTHEGAYINIQSTKPLSLGYGLCDSPAGLAGWLIEKFHDWTDWERFSLKDLLDNLTLYWMTGCAATSIRAYYGNSYTSPAMGKIITPTAIAAFPFDVLPVPEEWIRRNYPVVQFNRMLHGGHFTAMEAPEEFSADLKAFVNAQS